MKNEPKTTISRQELSNLKMVAGNEKKYQKVIDSDGKVIEWVGIGWIEIKAAEPNDYNLYPVIV
uniref:Uncharacterized protein n=1 Tax=viral metagenome TaxID=1070528 RepID=A0A6M3IMZ0_9ZZZZ